MNDAVAAASSSPPMWTIAPFALYLLLIAVIPLIAGSFWAKNRNKLIVAAILSVPVVLYLALGAPEGLSWLVESVQEYVAFMALLGALFVITGGIYLRGELAGTPIVNTAFLAFGALIANLIGTTGASLLLIRPLLRANEKRQRRVHMVVFFIFIVSNGAGLLTPLGDPPLFLGFLRGVPFFWALRLFGPWALVMVHVAGAVLRRRQVALRREERARPSAHLEKAIRHGDEPLRVVGGLNFVWLLGVIAVVYVSGAHADAISRNSPRPGAVPGGRPARDGRALVPAHAARGPPGQRLRLGADPRGGGGLRRHLRDHGARAARAGGAGSRPGRHQALAVLLGVGRAVELPRQRADLPDLRDAGGWRHQPADGQPPLGRASVGAGAATPGARRC